MNDFEKNMYQEIRMLREKFSILKLENAKLKDQLRWRPVSEKPEKDELIVIKYANGHMPSVLLYGGSTPWESIVGLYDIIFWLPTPPAPDDV